MRQIYNKASANHLQKMPGEWKKADVVSVYKKKNDKQLLKTIDQYLYCQSVVKFLRGYSITQCLSFSSKIT